MYQPFHRPTSTNSFDCLGYEQRHPVESFHQLLPVPHPKWSMEAKPLNIFVILLPTQKFGTKGATYLACVESINNSFDLFRHVFQFPLYELSLLIPDNKPQKKG